MADPFVAEIRAFPFNFAPQGWAMCNGQLMPISQNTALFSLLGTTYGGNGQSTFALPDLQGSVPRHVGSNQPGPGLSYVDLGEQSGSESVALLLTEMPQHAHVLRSALNIDPADEPVPSPAAVLAPSSGGKLYNTNSTNNLVQMAPETLAPAGGDLPHTNMQPYVTLNYCIAMQGVFPQRP